MGVPVLTLPLDRSGGGGAVEAAERALALPAASPEFTS